MKAELIEKVIKFKGGKRYEGETLFDAPCGNGRLYNENNKLIYSGHWMAGLPHGKGEFINEDDDVFKGFFQKGYKHGYGIVYNELGNVIDEGLWQFGNKSKEEIRYSQAHINNAKTEESLNLPRFNKFDRYVKYGKPVKKSDFFLFVGKTNFGKMTDIGYAEMSHGVYYLGQFENGERNGYGVMAFPNGDCYVGEFKNGWREGTGTYYWGSGDWSSGNWVEGKQSGQGKHYFNAGKCTFEGTWKNDKKSGEFTVYNDQNEAYAKQQYLKGELISSSILTQTEDAEIEEDVEEDVEKNAKTTFFGAEKDGKRTGWGILYQPSSKTKTYIVGNFKDDNPTEYVEIYDKKFKLTLAGFVDGQKQFNGYGTQILQSIFRETFFEKSQKLDYEITTKNYDRPENEQEVTFHYNIDYFDFTQTGRVLYTDTLNKLINEYSKLNNEKIHNPDDFQKRRELFLERRKEVIELFKEVENMNRVPIEKYLNPDHRAPIQNKEKEVKQIMNKTNISSQKEMEEFIDRKFEDLIGLENVKEQLKNIFALKVMQGDNYKLSDMNMAFIGNPGTGKSTVANIVTETLYEMGIIKENKCVNVSFKDLYGAYVGHSLKAINEQIAKAQGGVLFLDEAHQLASDTFSNSNFSKEIINSLITALENNRENTVFIFAGYKKEMKAMLNKSDRGFSSRIGRIVEFEDFPMEDLAILFTRMLAEQKNYQNKSFSITDDALGSILYLLEDTKADQGSNFGNAREVRILVRKVLEGFARINGDKDRTLITNLDLEDIFKGKIRIAKLKEKDGRDLN